MEYDILDKGDGLEIRVSGDVTFKNANKFKEAVTHFQNSGKSSVAFDVGAVSHMDSTGIGVFVLAYDAAKEKGGTVTVTNASANLKKLFSAVKLENLATVT